MSGFCRINCVVVVLLLLTVEPTTAAAQTVTVTVREMLDQQDQWSKWARDRTPLNVNGRYEGRAARQFRLARLSMLLSPGRTASLPRNPDAGQRLTVSGILVKSGNGYSMDVSRIAAGSTDSDRLKGKIEKSDQNHPEQWYLIADEFASIAEFYKDEALQMQVADLRQTAFQRQHTLALNDWQKLQQLADFGAEQGIDASELQAVVFESAVVMSRTADVDTKQLDDIIRRKMPEWDQPATGDRFLVPLPAELEQAFLKDPVAAYRSADAENRRRLHRRFYRSVRLPEILAGLSADGSNGREIAETLTAELPEETRQVSRTQQRYVDYRLTRVPLLTRRQLEELVGLLQQFERNAETQPALDVWLTAQEKRLNNGQLDGLLATAEEYLFVFERWKNPAHRDAGVEFLKRGWNLAHRSAPQEAAVIVRRLEQFGWTRLSDQWMTTAQMAQLPGSDVALAMREGRVVKGMKAPQILITMGGQPTRRIRVISARRIHEIWVYGEAGSSAITVHVQRGRSQSPDEAVATLVTTLVQ